MPKEHDGASKDFRQEIENVVLPNTVRTLSKASSDTGPLGDKDALQVLKSL